MKVEYPKGYYSTLEDVQSMTFMNPMGQSVPLTEMAQVRMVQGTQTVSRTDGRFSATINVIMTAKEKDAIMEEMQPQLDAMDFDDKANYITSMTDQMMKEEFEAIGLAIISRPLSGIHGNGNTVRICSILSTYHALHPLCGDRFRLYAAGDGRQDLHDRTPRRTDALGYRGK